MSPPAEEAARRLQGWWRGERADRRLANHLKPKGFEGPRKHLHASLRRAALAELRTTERAYVAKLQLLKTHFADPLLDAAAASSAAAPAAAEVPTTTSPEGAAPGLATFPQHLGAAFAELGRRCSALLAIPPDEDVAASSPAAPLLAAADVAAPPAAAPEAAPPSLRTPARHSSSTLDCGDEAASAPPLLLDELPSNLFQLHTIFKVHDELLARLREAGSSSHLAATLLGDGRLNYIFGCSGPYVQQHDRSSKQLEALRARSPELARFFMRAEEAVRAERAQRPHEVPATDDVSLTSLLMQPVQRIMRYKMLLEEVLKHTHPEHPDAAPEPDGRGLPEVLRRINQLLRISRQAKMTDDEQRAALRAACNRIRSRAPGDPDARSDDGKRLFEPAHRRLLEEFEGERTWVGLCTDRLLVADVDEPGRPNSSLSVHASWPDGLPLRGLRVIPASISGAGPGMLTVGGPAAPLSLSLVRAAADEASGPFGLAERDDRVKRWERALAAAIRDEEEKAARRAATIRRTLHSAAVAAVAAPPAAAASPAAASPAAASPAAFAAAFAAATAAAPTAFAALPPALPPDLPPSHPHALLRAPPPPLPSVPSDLSSALAAAASIVEARLGGVGSSGRLLPPEPSRSTDIAVPPPPPPPPPSSSSLSSAAAAASPAQVVVGPSASEDAATVAAAKAAAAEASWCLVPRLRRVARRWRHVRRSRAAASLVSLSHQDWWYQHRTPGAPGGAVAGPVSWATLVEAWRGGGVLRVWAPAVHAWLTPGEKGGGDGTGGVASPTTPRAHARPATPATTATTATTDAPAGAAAAASTTATVASPLALRAARHELERALSCSAVASEWMCTRHWAQVTRAHAAAPLGIALEGREGHAAGATLVGDVQPGGAVQAEGAIRAGDTLVEVHGRRVHSVREAEAALRGVPHAAVVLGVSRPWDAAAVGAWLRSLAPPTTVHGRAPPHSPHSPPCAAGAVAAAGADARWERVVQRIVADQIDGPTLAAMRQPELAQLCATSADRRPCLGFALRISCALARGPCGEL